MKIIIAYILDIIYRQLFVRLFPSIFIIVLLLLSLIVQTRETLWSIIMYRRKSLHARVL